MTSLEFLCPDGELTTDSVARAIASATGVSPRRGTLERLTQAELLVAYDWAARERAASLGERVERRGRPSSLDGLTDPEGEVTSTTEVVLLREALAYATDGWEACWRGFDNGDIDDRGEDLPPPTELSTPWGFLRALAGRRGEPEEVEDPSEDRFEDLVRACRGLVADDLDPPSDAGRALGALASSAIASSDLAGRPEGREDVGQAGAVSAPDVHAAASLQSPPVEGRGEGFALFRVLVDFVVAIPPGSEAPSPTSEAVESAALAVAGPVEILPGHRVLVRPLVRRGEGAVGWSSAGVRDESDRRRAAERSSSVRPSASAVKSRRRSR